MHTGNNGSNGCSVPACNADRNGLSAQPGDDAEFCMFETNETHHGKNIPKNLLLVGG